MVILTPSQIFSGIYELCLTTVLGSEPMLEGLNDFVKIHMVHNGPEHIMLEQFATYASKRDRPIIRSRVFVSFLVYPCDVGGFPFLWYHTCIQ